jgi:hypothetical protein
MAAARGRGHVLGKDPLFGTGDAVRLVTEWLRQVGICLHCVAFAFLMIANNQ